ERARELEMDPGVLCPNSALEAIAVRAPERGPELEELREVKGWFARSFGDEIAAVLADDREG
ncbi:MAG: HRDC domain-containing protein, partial [Myxococcota bacterium]|nr:HRDC domain-containing protein [Myxococcota bacterium]